MFHRGRGWVHFLATSRLCQRSSVPGVTMRRLRSAVGGSLGQRGQKLPVRPAEFTTTHADGREAIALTVRHRPDVVLPDIQMPAVDGPAALGEIHRLAPAVNARWR